MDVREKLEVIAHLGDHITYKEDIGICYDSALAKVIEDAYVTLKNGVTAQEWISVKDRLPEKGGSYLVFSNKSKTVFTAHYWLGDRWANRANGQFITHWMPLPQPPKGE